jgi:hypothetical protein
MITLRQIQDHKDGTASYNFNVDDKFIKYYIEQTGQPVTDELVGEFITKLIYEAAGESYTKSDRDFVKFQGE